MIHYLLELVLWLLLAFFIGAIIGCLLRRLFGGGEKNVEGAAGAGVATAVAGGAATAATAKTATDDDAKRREAEEEAARKKAEEEARRKAEQEAAAKKAEEEARRKAEQEAAAKKAEEEAARRKAEEEARRKAEQEVAAKKAEEEAARKKAEEETAAADAVKPWGLAGPIGGKADNLTRIKGIGSKINQILNEMGIYHFSQIAAWTEKEIEEVDEKLKFKGRIVRENWVEQARILAEGGETEFSRRVDEGEVPTSHTHETPPPDESGKTS